MLVILGLFVMAVMLVCSLIGCIYAMFLLIGTFSAAPFVTTSALTRHTMIELANITPGMHVVEIGSGIGSISTEAAQHGAIATGIEINPMLVWYARIRASVMGVGDRTTFVCKNFWSTPLSKETDVVFLYLMPGALKKLLPKLRRELRPGTVIISQAFSLPELTCIKKQGNVFLYLTPSA